MKGYGVHLLFHLLAIVAGGAAGVAAGLWWFARIPTALWIAGAALIVGIIVLVLEGLYISGVQGPDQPPRTRSRRRAAPRPPRPPRRSGGTRPDLQPVPPAAPEAVDGETRKSATDALREWSANHRS